MAKSSGSSGNVLNSRVSIQTKRLNSSARLFGGATLGES